MTVTRDNVERAKTFIRARLGNPYVYGGALSATNVKQGTDCSEVWQSVLEMAHGRWRQGRQAEGATTESYRYIDIGDTGPFGTIRVARPADIPANAAAKLAFHHGPGGGANSHMWGELDGMRIESAGSKGLVTAPAALAIDNSYATAWAYLPGPIVEDGTAIAPGPTVTTWGIDISNHQGDMDLARVKAEGFDFIWCKVSEGSGYRDPFWPQNRDRARAAGLILAGYHYVRTGDPAAQARLFVDHLGDTSIPAMLDFEDGSGDITQFWAVKAEVEKLGVRVSLSYIPDWYWERIGKPDLSKVPGLISSEYVSGTGYASVLYPGNQSGFWKAYGGRTPDVLQFTDRALVAGKSVDANAFRGTPDQLRALLTLNQPTTPPAEEDTTMLESISLYATPGETTRYTLPQMVQSIDGMTHRALIESAARYGDLDAIARIARVAAGAGKYRDPSAIRHATAILAEIEAQHPEYLQAYLATTGKA